MPKKIKNKNSKKKNKQEGHQTRMENRYPPVRQKRQGQKGSKKISVYHNLLKNNNLYSIKNPYPKELKLPSGLSRMLETVFSYA